MRKWFPLIAVSLGTFMLLVDVTIVTVALPALSTDLHASLDNLQWVLDAYALALAALLLGAGALADRHGRRRVYLAGTAVFALASLACAAAPSAGVLVAARFVQGIGGAAMFATTIAILSVAYSGKDRGVAFGIWGAVNGAAAAAGPIAGGLLTEHLGWRWIFLVNLPVSLVAIWFTVRGISESHGRGSGAVAPGSAPATAATRFDVPGTVAFTVAAGALTYALIRTEWTSAPTISLFALAAVALVVFILVERATDRPMLDLHLFRRPSFSVLMVTSMVVSAAAFAWLPFATVWLQRYLHHGPVSAGVLGALPMSAASFVVGAFGGRLLQRIAPRWTIGLGMLVIGAGDLLVARLHAGSPATALIPGLIVAGVGVSCALPSLSSATLASVPHERSGMASGALNTFRQLGFAVGVAAFGAIFRHQATGRPGAVEHAINHIVVAAGLLAVAAGLLMLAVRPNRPSGPGSAARESSPAAAQGA